MRGGQRHRLALEREVLGGRHAESPRRHRDDRRDHAGRHAGHVQGARPAAIRPHEEQVIEQPPASLARDIPVHDSATTYTFVGSMAGRGGVIRQCPSRKTPSSITTTAASMSPVTRAVLLSSTRSVAITLPTISPCTITEPARTVPWIRPRSPTMSVSLE